MVTGSLGLVRTFLVGINWDSSERDGPEGVCYWSRRILEDIGKIYGNEQIRDFDLIAPDFFESCYSEFSRIIESNNWKDTIRAGFDERKKCEDLLAEMHKAGVLLTRI